MEKLIDSSSFFNDEDLQVTILNAPGSMDSLIKAAADEQVQSYVEQLKITPGKMYLHINAMGAGEYYGSNRNGDYFPESVLKEHHKTFETSPAHVFRHHINKDPAKAIGKVILSIYNERMHRVELIAEVDRVLGKDVEDRIAAGDFPATSMACKTPYDVCSICGNKAHTRLEYCVHIKQGLNKVMPDGRKIMTLNVAPLKFFDISIVIKPADITSSVLQKVASEPAISSAEMAEMEGIEYEGREKAATHKKLSELVKEVEGYVVGSDSSLEGILAQIKDPDLEAFKRLESVPMEDLLKAMAELGINPSLKFLAELVAFRAGKHEKGIGELVVQAIRENGLGSVNTPDTDFGTSHDASPLVKKAMLQFVEGSSMFPEYIEKRAYGVRGYTGNGPHIQETEAEMRTRIRAEVMREQNHSVLGSNPLSVLLTIGGAALWAKAYINHLIEKKMEETHKAHVAPVIVKMAAVSVASEINEADTMPTMADMQAKLLKKSLLVGPVGKKVSQALKTVNTAKDLANKFQGS